MPSATQLKPETETGRTYVGVIPYICVSNAREAAKLYEKALGAEVIDQRPTEDGRLIHCEMIINGGRLLRASPYRG
jgi:PhnB protein